MASQQVAESPGSDQALFRGLLNLSRCASVNTSPSVANTSPPSATQSVTQPLTPEDARNDDARNDAAVTLCLMGIDHKGSQDSVPPRSAQSGTSLPPFSSIMEYSPDSPQREPANRSLPHRMPDGTDQRAHHHVAPQQEPMNRPLLPRLPEPSAPRQFAYHHATTSYPERASACGERSTFWRESNVSRPEYSQPQAPRPHYLQPPAPTQFPAYGSSQSSYSNDRSYPSHGASYHAPRSQLPSINTHVGPSAPPPVEVHAPHKRARTSDQTIEAEQSDDETPSPKKQAGAAPCFDCVKTGNDCDMSTSRCAISHIFGRNKGVTRLLPAHVKPDQCRKSYQRRKYDQDVKEHGRYYIYQSILCHRSIDKIENWWIVDLKQSNALLWTIKMTTEVLNKPNLHPIGVEIKRRLEALGYYGENKSTQMVRYAMNTLVNEIFPSILANFKIPEITGSSVEEVNAAIKDTTSFMKKPHLGRIEFLPNSIEVAKKNGVNLDSPARARAHQWA